MRLFTAGYSFKSLPNFQELHHSESTKITEQYMSLMEKELFLQDINPKPDIYETYDVRMTIFN